MSKLCLFDASGYIHRAFHAIPPLTNSKGEPLNAVYGFSRMISKVLKEEKPEYMAVCFDTPSPTFRHVQYAEYKATRTELDPSLVPQLPLAEALARAWGLPCIKMEGYEADDIIATLAVQAEHAGYEVLILSGDKDILQLVGPRIHVKDEIKKVEYDEAKVFERYGFKPQQLIDYLCLLGDKVDNVPGAAGVGEKTATKLIATHGSLEKIYEKLEENSPSLKEKLAAAKKQVFSNRDLIRLKTDVPFKEKISNLKIQSPDSATLSELLTRFEFRGGLYGVSDDVADPTLQANTKRVVHTVLSLASLKTLESKLKKAKRLSYDLETDGLDTSRCDIVGVAVSVEEGESWYIPVKHSYMGAPDQLPWIETSKVLQPLLEEKTLLKCGQNLKFDNAILERHGIFVVGPFFDTMIAAYCVDPGRNSFGLKDLAADILHERMTRIDELIGKSPDANFSFVPIEQAAPYAAADAEVVFRLVDVFNKKLDDEGTRELFENLEMPLVQIIQSMESTGIRVDVPYLADIGKSFEKQRRAIEQEIFKLAGEEFVLNSPKQLARILFEKLKLPPVKKTKTGFSTDEEVLNKLSQDHPICAKIILVRELGKLNSTYVESILKLVDEKTSRVHTSFNQTGTITGRLSSSEPNLQNIPIRTENGRLIRRAFVASPQQVLVSADYSQIDLRSLAHMSGDPALIEAFHQGGDVHAATASDMFNVALAQVTPEMRRSAKAINFGIVYGQQAYALSQSLNIPMDKAKEFIQKYFEKYAGVRAWIESTLENARKTMVVSTLAGRRRRVPEINSANSFTRGFAERVAVNTPIQGTSADIIKFAMIRVFDDLKKSHLKTKMLLQVHDELLFDCPKDELKKALPLIRHGMEGAFKLRVPLVVDIKTGHNWADMEKIKEPVAA
ncbi:MAG: DNA polymerase I [Elusimicrobia bacterium]|nr:DNA polymerase I [Elusimicrobiota bacterium]